jgi:DNA polymerase-1
MHRAFYASPHDYRSLAASWVDTLVRLHRPAEVFLAIDSARSFRRDFDPSYKAGRNPKPTALTEWLDQERETMKPPDGYEADDLIAARIHRHDGEAIVVSGDLDLCAVVNGRVSLVRPPDWGTALGPEDVYRKLGVYPDQVCAYKSLAGDTSDNIRGASGIGPVKARKLLATYGTFEGVLPNLTESQQEEAKAAWKLVALRTDLEDT